MDLVDPLFDRFTIFVLAIFIGYFAMTVVTPAMHNRALSVIAALTSIIIVGAMLVTSYTATSVADVPLVLRVMGFLAIILAAANFVAGIALSWRQSDRDGV